MENWPELCVNLCEKNFPNSAKIDKNRKKLGNSYLTNSVGYNNLRRLGNPEVRIPNPCAASSILAGGTSKIDILQRKRKQIESFIRDHSEAEFTHSICPKCAKKF